MRPWLIRSTAPKVTATPRIAEAMGRSMAITDPKASSRMTTAARIPSPSLAPKAAFSIFSIGAPPSCTSNPGRAMAWARLTTWRIEASGRRSLTRSNWIVA